MASVTNARHFLRARAAEFSGGDDLDVETELPKLLAVLSSLLDAGIVEEADWLMPGVLFAERIVAIASWRSVISGRILERLRADSVRLSKVELQIAVGYSSDISSLVVEMATCVLAHEVMLLSVAEFLKRPIKSGIGQRDVKSAKHRVPFDLPDPEVHLKQATASLLKARADVARAKDRVRYIKRKGGVNNSSEVMSKLLPARETLRVVGPSVSRIRSPIRKVTKI